MFAIAPPTPTGATGLVSTSTSAASQTLTVSSKAVATQIKRDIYLVTPGYKTLAKNGTNYDWATLVLVSGGWPVTEASVTVMVRWMRQENGPNNWWNRNNPMNNGYGSGGGGGTGSYANLVIAAQKAAENLQRNPSFNQIEAAFAAGAPSATIEHAIWASPWASSHYGNGSRWHYTPVPVVKAPVGAW
ncbi:MAG: hypothetical protein ABI053_05030 [Lacisediminihabitans sp.]